MPQFPLGLPEEYGITGGAFVDYGSLWDPGVGCADVLYCDFTPRGVAGLSMFWKTPVGPLRFNWTTAFDAQTDDILGFFIRGGQMTVAGVANAATAYAQTVDDPEVAAQMEQGAARLLVGA